MVGRVLETVVRGTTHAFVTAAANVVWTGNFVTAIQQCTLGAVVCLRAAPRSNSTHSGALRAVVCLRAALRGRADWGLGHRDPTVHTLAHCEQWYVCVLHCDQTVHTPAHCERWYVCVLHRGVVRTGDLVTAIQQYLQRRTTWMSKYILRFQSVF